jgi:Endonuclease/Exonuclease/phosphatase family.
MVSKKYKVTLIVLLTLLAVLLLAAGGYVLYVCLQYYRIPDVTLIETAKGGVSAPLEVGKTYTALTYNIGFGAYDDEYSFFMDTGVMADGTPVQGKYGKARDKKSVERNTQGAVDQIVDLNPDFALIQEVDEKSDRAFRVNQKKALIEAFPSFSSAFAINFHSAWLAYPFTDPHGKTKAGLLTLSRNNIERSVRMSYPVDGSFPSRFFDLDRCFDANYIPVENGKYLVLVNSHMSAYDEGGLIRKQQLKKLNAFMEEEYLKGNYVIVGGDFNHTLGAESAGGFPSLQQYPEWVHELLDEDIAPGLSIVINENVHEVATCRAADIPYEKGVNFTATIDGFIVSDNVEAVSRAVDNAFKFSDHHPVVMEFRLK